MDLQSLKITINLSSGAILDRFLTIDSILLGIYYRAKEAAGKKSEFVDNTDDIVFLEKREGILSGSIWYIDEKSPLLLDFRTYYKKSDTKLMQEHLNKKTQQRMSSGEFKAYMLDDEVMSAPSVYFYVKGNKEIIEKLLLNGAYGLKFLGKKASQGFGKVASIEIEDIDEDKSFFITDSTPSKPLPINKFKVKSKKIAMYRDRPPYWLNKDIKPCYMPTTALYELEDKSYLNKNLSVAKKPEHITSALRFVREIEDSSFTPFTVLEDKRKGRWSAYDYVEGEESLVCRFSGFPEKRGVIDSSNSYMRVNAKYFTDNNYSNGSKLIGESFLWSTTIEMLRKIPNTLYQEGVGVDVGFDSSKKDVKIIDILSDPSVLKPPYFFGLKSIMNSQHILFKGKVSISTGMNVMQYGNDTLFIDGELLQCAIADLKKILSDTKKNGISKSHLCGLLTEKKHVFIKSDFNTKENRDIVNKFHKKYNKDIRIVLFLSKDIA